MVFITIPNHKTQSITLDPNTTTLHSLKLSLHHHTHIPIHHLHRLYLSQSHPLPSQNDAVLLSCLRVVLDRLVLFEIRVKLWSRNQLQRFAFVLRWTRGGELSVVEFEWGGARLGSRLGEEREIVDLGLLTQTKISKDLFLRPKSPSLFHLSKALKSLSQIVDLEKSLKLSLRSMVVKWWLVWWLVGVDCWMGLTLVWVAMAWWTDRWQWRGWGRRWFGFGIKVYLPPISHRSVGLY